MALIACPDCGKRVSDLAAACPSCARPLGGRPPGEATVIELTAKGWKMVQAAGIAVMFLAPVSVAMIAAAGSEQIFAGIPVLIGLGVAVHLVGRVGAWWHHG